MVRHAGQAPYRRALVAVDFSPWSERQVALARAVAPDAHLLLMHCVEVPFEARLRNAGVKDASIERWRMTARDDAVAKLRELGQRAGLDEGRWTALAPTGLTAWMQLVRQEQEQDCDLVVVGKHGQNAVEELLLGSTTNMVIAEGASDVLVSVAHDATA